MSAGTLAQLKRDAKTATGLEVIRSVHWPKLEGRTFPMERRQANGFAVRIPDECLNDGNTPKGPEGSLWWLYWGKAADHTYNPATGTFTTHNGNTYRLVEMSNTK